MRKGFTLIEVNLAMLVMAIGILTVVGLYAFGYRENRQSREDVAATAVADIVVSQLMTAITAPEVAWSDFKDVDNYPGDKGWGEYFDSNGVVHQDPTSKAQSAFDSLMSQLKISSKCPDIEASFPKASLNAAGMECGLVILHEKNSPVISIAFRATKQPGTLLSMPLFYCEGRFQGDPNK